MWKIYNFFPQMGIWGNFGSQKMRSVLNRAIFYRFASHLDCSHYFKISTHGKQERPNWGQFVPLLGSNFLPKFLFYPNFFLFFFFFLTFFLIKFFLLFFLFFTTFNNISKVIQVYVACYYIFYSQLQVESRSSKCPSVRTTISPAVFIGFFQYRTQGIITMSRASWKKLLFFFGSCFGSFSGR